VSQDGTREEASGPPAEPNGEEAQGATAEGDRRRRREQVFGDVLPDGTTDERGDGWSEGDSSPESGARSEEWLRRQVPPHHG